MRWTIVQVENRWVVQRDDVTLSSELSYGKALVALTASAGPDVLTAAAAPEGALPEGWTSGPGGIVGQYVTPETPDTRDFSGCTFTWRDMPLPLMLQTTTDFGHFGAVLCGWMDTAAMVGNHVEASGWFHASEDGVKARDILAAQGQFGCSVDPGTVEAEWECTDYADDGWCDAGTILFMAYQVAGLTMTPFPAFEQCWLELGESAAEDAGEPEEEAVPVAAAASVPMRPPRDWFTLAEPDDDDPRWVEQPDGQRGVPLTITDDGQVYGHAGLWGTCHIGKRSCITPPESQAAYAHFHVGELHCGDGSTLATGSLTAGCDHAALALGASEARDWYANAGASWADVRASNGRAGVWVCGALRAGLSDEQLRVLRALALSGDWRRVGGSLELIGVLSVNYPGFPIARETLLAGALMPVTEAVDARLAYRTTDLVEPLALVASGITLPARAQLDELVASGTLCGDCARRSQPRAAARSGDPELRAALARIERKVDALDMRTRHLRADAAAALRRELSDV